MIEAEILSEKRRLTPKQLTGLEALIATGSQTEAAKAAGVTARTMRSWLHEPTFAAEYRVARRALVIGAIARAQGLVTGAINTMAALARDTEQPGSVRLSAAKELAAVAIKGLETEDMLARIEALEARAEQPAISGNPGLRKVV